MNSLPDLNVTPSMDDSTTNRIKDESMALDRLNKLPDPLIHVILSFLPMRDVAATMLLTKRWKDLWTTVPYLHFYFRKEKDSHKFPNFVKGALERWKGNKILKFSINLQEMEFEYDHSDVDSWVRFAVDKHVEELCVKLICYEYHLPDPVYLCSSIRKLSLHFLGLDFKESVSWNQLNSLTIDGTFNLTQDVINQILLGARLLEVFDLRTELIFGDLYIRSTSLKMLKIYYYDIDAYDDNVETPTVVRISAPILESLEFAGIRYTRCLLKVLSMTNTNVDFDVILEVEPSWRIEVGEMFSEAVLGISHALKLTLNKWLLMLLVDQMKEDTIVLFSNAKFLKLCAVDAEGMLNVLEMFPELKKLIVERMEYGEYKPMVCDMTFPRPSLLHLKTVEITWCVHDDKSIIPVIKTVLENAPVLEKMVLRLGMLGGDLDPSNLAEEMRMWIFSSDDAHVEFCH